MLEKSYEKFNTSFFSFKVGELLTEGNSKNVYLHPENPEQVRCVFRNECESETDLKGSLYLTKILHLLFPKNIPDMYGFQYNPGINWSYVDRQLINIDKSKETQVSRKSQEWQSLVNSIGQLGVSLDTGNRGNFAFDDKGNFWYVDSVDSWGIRNQNQLIANFDCAALQNAIMKLSPDKQEEALNYFEQLKNSFEQEKSELEDKKES